MGVQQTTGSFALCVEDGGMEDLEARKVYQVLPDREASREGYVRVIDESGDDYVYPSDLFVPVKLPTAVVRRFKRRTERGHPLPGAPFDDRPKRNTVLASKRMRPLGWFPSSTTNTARVTRRQI